MSDSPPCSPPEVIVLREVEESRSLPHSPLDHSPPQIVLVDDSGQSFSAVERVHSVELRVERGHQASCSPVPPTLQALEPILTDTEHFSVSSAHSPERPTPATEPEDAITPPSPISSSKVEPPSMGATDSSGITNNSSSVTSDLGKTKRDRIAARRAARMANALPPLMHSRTESFSGLLPGDSNTDLTGAIPREEMPPLRLQMIRSPVA
ncbi:hypothetical protein ADEAN_000127400 [Angomonas deanei]|uniref:Uncharacterized protein n=1 Tax=Angomonas deanei TaxID=59799 RepID=A0A7G2C3V3_9TRYP|nr:hypothetical protein ADEAN_000127400 [Angomonas deanei]